MASAGERNLISELTDANGPRGRKSADGRQGHRGSPRAHQSGDAHDLALSDRQRDVRETRRRGQSVDRENAPARRGLARRELLAHVTAHHVSNQRLARECGGRLRHHVPAIAQHRHRVREREDLVEAM